VGRGPALVPASPRGRLIVPASHSPGEVTLRPWTVEDTAAVVSLWNESIGERYPLRPDVLRALLGDDPSHQPDDALVAADERSEAIVGFGYLTVTRLPDSELDPFRSRAHLQALVVHPSWRRSGIGRRLAAALVDVDVAAGQSTVEAGGGFFYLWPAIPADLPDAVPFAQALGLTPAGTTFDLLGDVRSVALDDQARGALAAADVRVDHATATDRGPLLRYLDREFGGEWWHDIRWALDEGLDPSRIVLLRGREGERGEGGEIVGHARIHLPEDAPLGPPLFWTARLEGRTGGLGPIGVAARLRGRGLGRALLVAALDEVRRAGMEAAVIDATSLEGFYGPLGFRPWMTFRHASGPTATVIEALRSRAAAPSR
jgi:predicted N-acetyltransferase YhbS